MPTIFKQFSYGNTLIQSLATSFFMGYIMYYLLEYRPKRKDREKIMETYIKNKIDSILTTYHNLLIILATGDGNMKVPKIDEEFNNIETEALHLNRKMKLTSYPVYSNNIDKNNYTVEQFIKDVGFKTNQNCSSILNYIIYLDIELVNILAEVESSSNSLINFAPSDMPDCKLSMHKEIFIENTTVHKKLIKYYSENISDLPGYLID